MKRSGPAEPRAAGGAKRGRGEPPAPQPVDTCREQTACRYRDDPCPQEIDRDPPSYGGYAFDGSRTDHGAGDGMCRADGDTEIFRQVEREGPCSLCGETFQRRYFRDLCTHRLHDPDMVPRAIKVQHASGTQVGMSVMLSPRPPETNSAAAMTPMTFSESFSPCPMLNSPEERVATAETSFHRHHSFRASCNWCATSLSGSNSNILAQ